MEFLPGTKFVKRYREGYRGVNALDHACMYHDLIYSLTKEVDGRNKADEVLSREAQKIIDDPETSAKERTDARVVKHIMDIKAKFGL